MNRIWLLGLIAAMAMAPRAIPQDNAGNAVNPKLEQQLWGVEQRWLESASNRKLDVLQDLWTDQFVEINSGGTTPGKKEQLARLAAREPKPGVGAFPDDFKLRAVYGDFALATDHTTLKGISTNGYDFSGEYRVLRMFVKEHSKWRVAGAALVPIAASARTSAASTAPAPAQRASQEDASTAGSRSELEQQLWQIEQQWLAAEHDQKIDFLRQLWADQFFDILGNGQYIGREDMLNRLASAQPKPGTGAFPSDFKLRAVYGDHAAIATDHTTLKGLGPANGEYRVMRLFVKERGKWKVAGAALVPIIQTQQTSNDFKFGINGADEKWNLEDCGESDVSLVRLWLGCILFITIGAEMYSAALKRAFLTELSYKPLRHEGCERCGCT
jgi:ketosteroid isomerase-like protein